MEAAEAALRSSGAAVEEVRPPGGGHAITLDVWRSYGGGDERRRAYGVLRRWDAFRTEMLAFGERYDLILSPVFARPAPLHGDVSRPGEVDPTSFTTPHSLTGWPSATVRAGASAAGLPIDVQLAARPWRDDVALAAALAVERLDAAG